ncbi:hypothetical protein [Bradyrhizobium elkanii]|uniref:hypothetical protein n=1 Tax=Bradyrhizobium elkanii TaxID=29448 RepID=UPI001BAE0D93|nr:hypothetical protein [Bradyrhizobium elkanii]MBR1164241.1 hypothetical protein [Bradyrhizobium elkanii]
MNLNLDSDFAEQVSALDPGRWSNLQAEMCLNIANARFYAFVAESEHAAGLVRLGLISRGDAADHLHTAAVYNQLYFEYGAEAIQKIMADAMTASGVTDA